MSDTAASVVVAKARVDGKADIELTTPTEVRVTAGQTLVVKYHFSFDEASRDREHWRFNLVSQIGDQKARPAQTEWPDRWGLHDELWGQLRQEYRFDKPGRYVGEFRVAAEYSRSGWRSRALLQKEARQRDGEFRVIVEPRPTKAN